MVDRTSSTRPLTASASLPPPREAAGARRRALNSVAAERDCADAFYVPESRAQDQAVAADVTQRVAANFVELCQAVGLDSVLTKRWLERVLRCYSEPQRHYHGISHIDAMLQGMRKAETPIHHPEVLRLAVIFHDIVYDPRRPDNESASMRLFDTFAREAQLPAPWTDAVLHLIDRTKQHNGEEAEHADLLLFLDLDLEVLSRDADRYAVYAQQIRQEYAHVPSPLFGHIRGLVLAKFLQRPTLYFTQIFQERHEQAARRNVETEIERLSQLTRGPYARGIIGLWELKQVATRSWKRFRAAVSQPMPRLLSHRVGDLVASRSTRPSSSRRFGSSRLAL